MDSERLAPTAPTRNRTIVEILIVLGLSLGQSAVYSIVRIIDLSTREQSLGSQSTSINNALNQREAFDLIYQLLSVIFGLMPVVLVCFLLWRSAAPHLSRLGIDGRHPVRDTLWGAGLALIIGAGGIGVYLGGRALGSTVAVSANGLDAYWWTIIVLVLRAFLAGASEEVVVIGYLFARLRELGWRDWPIILSAAVLRGSYHLYQGYGSFVGNLIMGVVFGWLYSRTGRVLPLVIAHTLIDAVIFIGYPWAAATFPELFGVPTPAG